jgi:hypothetical protein
MRRPLLLGLAVLAMLGVGFWFGEAAAQTGAVPGSTQDPLASVSYVTQAISSALQGQVPSLITQGVQAALPGVVTPLVQSTVQTQLQAALKSLPTGGASVAVVSVPPGQEIVAAEGTEFVLRGGSATVQLAPTSGGGLADLTTGQNLAQGAVVPQNQLLIAARSDERGLVPVGKARILVLVIGQYTLEPVQ